MSKGTGFRPKLFPPRGRQLRPNRRPLVTCFLVSLSIAILVLVVFGLTAYNIYHNRFGAMERLFHGGDMVSLRHYANDLSPVFCSGYTVELPKNATAYLLPSTAKMDLQHHENFTVSWTFHPLRDVEYRTYYLLPYSGISVTTCRSTLGEKSLHYEDDDAEMSIIIGMDIFKNWLRNHDPKYVYKSVFIPFNATCDKPSLTLPRLDIIVQFADTYHIVLHSRHRVDISVTANISRTRYNISNALSVCMAPQNVCYFPLSWGDTKDIVVEMGDEGTQRNMEMTFYTDCSERIVFWVCIFGLLPFTLVLLSSACCGYILGCNRSLESKYHQESDHFVQTTPSYGATENCNAMSTEQTEEDGYTTIQS